MYALETSCTGVSIKFEVGSWLKKNSRLYEQEAVRPINLGGSGGMLPQKILKSGGSEMPFPAFWAPNYHASTSGNYSLCMAIRCEIKLKKHSGFNIRYWANDFTNKTWGVFLYLSLFFSCEPTVLGKKKHTRIVCRSARQAAETIIRSNERKKNWW